MKNTFIRKCAGVFILFLFSCMLAQAQFRDSCEGTVPAGWQPQGGKLSLSTRHFKLGKESLKWDWTSAKDAIEIRDTAFLSVAANPRSTFVLWLYNEKPVADSLLFAFEKDGETVCRFNVSLNFRGWRTAWVMYHRDMAGRPVEGMDQLTIRAPSSVKKGSLYFDQVLYHVTINPRSPMRDEQVPFVNIHSDKAANAHWTALYQFSRIPHYLPLGAKPTSEDIRSIDTITSRYEQILLTPLKKRKYKLTDIENAFRHWDIRRTKNTLTGKPVYSVNDSELAPSGADEEVRAEFKHYSIKNYTELMLNVAAAYRTSQVPAETERYGRIFLDLLDHLDDQGWTSGSGMGALHHLGYNFRDYYSACLLMKPLLKQQHRLEKTWKSMYWFSGLGRTQVPPEKIDDSNIDVFNTLLGSMLSSVLIMDNTPEKVRQLQEFSAWLSKTIMPTYSIDGTFKPDGAVVHHGNLYPAYGIGGFQGIAPIVYVLSKTPFEVLPQAHEELKKVLLTMHYYTNPVKWPVSVSGRHPTGNWKIADAPYAYLALAGTPDGKQPLDREMAAVYLKINSNKKDTWVKQFTAAGISPAAYPHGHWNLNYGLFDIHRRQDWLLTVRGHNRYFTTHESYPGANMYGRYLSYGHLEVLFPQSEADSGSNFKDEGWDWNAIPGTTTLHLPLAKLRANILNVDDFSGVEEMLLSDEIFAGGTNLKQWHGMFAMKLHGHDKYDMGSFRAIKSWFMFDSLAVCLGSNITNEIAGYPTQTTLFQNSLKTGKEPFFINSKETGLYPYSRQWNTTESLSLIDNRGIGYYLPAQKNVVFSKSEQQSRDQKDSHDTRGKIAKLILDHGKAPQHQTYEYAMLIKADTSQMNQFKRQMNSRQPVYKILQQDSLAHTVWYAPEQITASALFTQDARSKDSIVVSNSRPCLVMYQNRKDNHLLMAVTDPDLAFYSGPDDSPLTPDGKRQEVSIYSRSWYRTPSKPSVVRLVIKGSWKVTSSADAVEAQVLPDGNTQLSVSCKYGLATEIKLEKSVNK